MVVAGSKRTHPCAHAGGVGPSMSASFLYPGTVVHTRLRPVRHRLRYRMLNMLLDLDELPGLDRRLRLFGHNRRALFSFHDADHGDGSATPLRRQVEGHPGVRGVGVLPWVHDQNGFARQVSAR